MTQTMTIATWEQITQGRRDTNPFDHVETQLRPHHLRVGIYDVVRNYSTQVAACLPGHIDFIDNRFVAQPHAVQDLDAEREAIVAAIQEADRRHREVVEDWIS